MSIEADLAALVEAALAARTAPIVERLDRILAAIEADRTAPALLATRDAARVAGYPSPAALRAAAARHVAIASARVGRRWDRARLLGAVADVADGGRAPRLRAIGGRR